MIAVADKERDEARLIALGAEVVVGRDDPAQAIETIVSAAGGGLRFGLDAVGKETSTFLQEALRRSEGNKRRHLVGLTGLPKERVPEIQYHSVPIKVFHNVPLIGELATSWLERLLVEKVVQTPDITVASGGLQGINGALDELRKGSVSGNRIVVPIKNEGHNVVSPGETADESKPITNDLKDSSLGDGDNGSKPKGSQTNGQSSTDGTVDSKPKVTNLDYADKLNSDPSRIKFA